MTKKRWTIAIDGPSGAGKSTVARALAEKLGIYYLDTGAMYRGLGYVALKEGLVMSREADVLDFLNRHELTVQFSEGKQLILVDDLDVTDYIRSPEVSRAASDISAISAVRRYLVERQRKLSETESFVLDGRDIGTVVLPHAELKIFLTADPAIRGQRRYLELQAKLGPKAPTLESVIAEMQYRDQQDSSRVDSPTKQAEDAYLIDSSHLGIETVLEYIFALIAEKGRTSASYEQ